MGYTRKTWDIIQPLLFKGMSVCDLGSQNDFTLPHHPYTRERYEREGINYTCLDVNGKGGSIYFDLGTLGDIGQFDLVVDAGTKEHVLSLTRAFQNHYNMTKKGGLMYCENPKVGSWLDHGHHYFTQEFYHKYAKENNCEILLLEDHPASDNTIDGWEVICLMRKL